MPSIRERNRRLIIDAASEAFASQGFEASKVEDIAARAGVPKANVHYYFETKRKLYTCVLDGVLEPMLRAARSLDPQVAPQEALERYLRAKTEVVSQHPHACRVLVREMLHGDHHLAGNRATVLREVAQQNVACLSHWMDKGLIVRTAPEHLLLFLWSMPLAHIRFAPPGCPLEQAQGPAAPLSVEALTRLVLRGVHQAPAQCHAIAIAI